MGATRKGGGESGKVKLPKGCVMVAVGGEGETPEIMIVPLRYLDHPLFGMIWLASAERFGRRYVGPVKLLCPIEEFRYIRRVIDEDFAAQPCSRFRGCFRV